MDGAVAGARKGTGGRGWRCLLQSRRSLRRVGRWLINEGGLGLGPRGRRSGLRAAGGSGSLSRMSRSPKAVRSATTFTAASSASGGSGTEPGVSFPGITPAVHGTPLPAPRTLVPAGSAAHLSQHCWPHREASAHATHTLHPRVAPHAAQQAAGGSDRPRGPYPSWTTSPSRSVLALMAEHEEAHRSAPR
eukprot:scaffold5469_cov91-Isochrysis_galbana.AAC.1